MTGRVPVPLWLLILGGLVILFLALIVWSVKRRSKAHLTLDEGGVSDVLHSIVGMTQSTLTRGNAMQLLHNGAFFDALWRDLEAARASIHIEMFLARKGEVTRRLADVLARKSREGVHVRLLLDGSGARARKYGKKLVEQMRQADCEVVFYHPLKLSNLGRINNRTHRKIVVVDGRIGYVGGHCLADQWLGQAQDKKHFRDLSVRVEGPVVAQLQSAFTDNWLEETGEVFGGQDFFPEPAQAGQTTAHMVFVSPTGAPSTLKVLHYMAIKAAKKSIIIQNPYFLPDPEARDALVEAVGRGVEVRIMIPDTSASDAPFVQHASHHHYGTLLKGGVRLFDYHRTLLHQKVISIDGCWSAIGSTNFDDRSFEINDEVALVIFDERMAAELQRTFEEDARHAKERHLDEWKSRPLLHKLVDGTIFLINEQL